MANLAALRELYAWMLENPRVEHARCGELELRVGPPRSTEEPVVPFQPQSAEEQEADDLAVLLHSSGADPSPFLRRRAG